MVALATNQNEPTLVRFVGTGNPDWWQIHQGPPGGAWWCGTDHGWLPPLRKNMRLVVRYPSHMAARMDLRELPACAFDPLHPV